MLPGEKEKRERGERGKGGESGSITGTLLIVDAGIPSVAKTKKKRRDDRESFLSHIYFTFR